jgi:hypothetical protein
MKPDLWNVDTFVSWLPLPYELQCKIFKWNRKIYFTEKIALLDKKIKHFLPLHRFCEGQYYMNTDRWHLFGYNERNNTREFTYFKGFHVFTSFYY